MNSHTSRLLVLGVALLFFSAVTVRAQEQPVTAPKKAPGWVKNFGKQLQAQLESEDPAIKAQTLHHITYFASFYDEKIDFSDAIPALVDLYRHDGDANVRFFALVALHTIGEGQGMRKVRNTVSEQRWPPLLQLVSLSALVDYYGADTLSMDRDAARMAERLITLYKPMPGIEVGPLEVLEVEESKGNQ